MIEDVGSEKRLLEHLVPFLYGLIQVQPPQVPVAEPLTRKVGKRISDARIRPSERPTIGTCQKERVESKGAVSVAVREKLA